MTKKKRRSFPGISEMNLLLAIGRISSPRNVLNRGRIWTAQQSIFEFFVWLILHHEKYINRQVKHYKGRKQFPSRGAGTFKLASRDGPPIDQAPLRLSRSTHPASELNGSDRRLGLGPLTTDSDGPLIGRIEWAGPPTDLGSRAALRECSKVNYHDHDVLC